MIWLPLPGAQTGGIRARFENLARTESEDAERQAAEEKERRRKREAAERERMEEARREAAERERAAEVSCCVAQVQVCHHWGQW